MTILVTGATGLVGREIVKLCLDRGIEVHYLTSSRSKLVNDHNYKGFYWDIVSGEIDLACFEGVTAVIHLAGASISKRWTRNYKQEILDSRIRSTELLRNAIEQHQFPVQHFISASAIGIYPSCKTHYYEEDYRGVSKSFLGEVVEQWETAADTLAAENRIVSKLRIGLVLAKEAGALAEIVKPVRLGLGAAFGDGLQWQSWIHIADLARIFLFVLEEELEGTVNAVAPNPVTNQELTKTIAKVLDRPLFMPKIPKLAMQIALGEMAMLLFESQRVASQKIEGEGFQFIYPNLEPAIEDLLP